MQKQISLKIHGEVQGVFFRDSSRIEAETLDLSGWVKNDPDGTVMVVAEGEDQKLKKFIEWCKYGPDHAEVEKVSIQWAEATGQFNNFVVK